MVCFFVSPYGLNAVEAAFEKAEKNALDICWTLWSMLQLKKTLSSFSLQAGNGLFFIFLLPDFSGIPDSILRCRHWHEPN